MVASDEVLPLEDHAVAGDPPHLMGDDARVLVQLVSVARRGDPQLGVVGPTIESLPSRGSSEEEPLGPDDTGDPRTEDEGRIEDCHVNRLRGHWHKAVVRLHLRTDHRLDVEADHSWPISS